MPFALLIVGLMLLVSAMRGTTAALGTQLKLDLLGDGQRGGFIVWIVIIAILTTVGSISASYGRKDMQKLTQLFMGVVLAALVLRNPNVVQQFVNQIQSAPISPAIDANIEPAKDTATVKEADAGAKTGDILLDVSKLATRTSL